MSNQIQMLIKYNHKDNFTTVTETYFCSGCEEVYKVNHEFVNIISDVECEQRLRIFHGMKVREKCKICNSLILSYEEYKLMEASMDKQLILEFDKTKTICILENSINDEINKGLTTPERL